MRIFLEPCPFAKKKIGDNAVLEIRKFDLSLNGNNMIKQCDCCDRTKDQVDLYEAGVYKLPTYYGIQGNILCEDCINFIYDFYFTEEKPKKVVKRKTKNEKRV